MELNQICFPSTALGLQWAKVYARPSLLISLQATSTHDLLRQQLVPPPAGLDGPWNGGERRAHRHLQVNFLRFKLDADFKSDGTKL